MGYVPSPPKAKTLLSKPKTHDHTSTNFSRPGRSSSSSSSSSSSKRPSQRETNKNGPKNLKQQLQQIPEATRRLSLETFRRSSSDSADMGVKDRYPKAITTAAANSSASTKSASSSLNSPSPLARQLSVVHEAPGMDIASAINLLQELKKTATPEELVALHRALLPQARQGDSGIDGSLPRDEHRPVQYPSQRNSKLPPGLNTRGEPGDDLLKRLGDEVRQPESVRRQDSGVRQSSARRSASVGNATVPEVAHNFHDDTANRSTTPSDQEYSQTGAYRTGTLRVTNGAASPDPTQMFRQATQLESTSTYDNFSDSPIDPHFTPNGTKPALTESFPGVHRLLHSEQRKPSRPLPPPPSDSRRSSDASVNQVPNLDSLVLEATPAEPQEPESNDRASNESPAFVLARPPFPRQHTNNTDTPPSSNRASLSEDSSSLNGSKTTVAQFASRLSTVFGEPESGEDSPGTPNHAWAKLTGEPRPLGPREPRSIKSAKSLNSQRPDSASNVDSGYGSSDASSQNQDSSPKLSQETPRAHDMVPRDDLTSRQDGLAAKADGDAGSLYTFSEFISSAKTPSEEIFSTTNPANSSGTPSDIPKKDLPAFLGLRDKAPSKRMSLPAGNLASNDSLTSLTSTNGSEKSSKPKRKLRKPMPEPERIRREKSFRVRPTSEIFVNECPLVSDDMNKSLDQRYFQPSEDQEINRSASETQNYWDDGSRESGRNVKVNAPSGARKNPFQRNRSASRGRTANARGRETTDDQEGTERGGRFQFLRSLSRSRSRRRRASIDSADCNTPIRNDFASLASSDAPSRQDTPRAQPDRGGSRERGTETWRTGPPLKQKSKSMGMTEAMASELARSKSRDVAGHERAASHDRPRMATPKKSNAQSHSRSPSVGPPKSGRSVEDFVPGWHSKESSPEPASALPRPDLARRPFSMYADSIPPMPDIPVDVAAKAAKANKMMLKKKKDGVQQSFDLSNESAVQSAQNSAASSPNIGRVKRAVMEREEQERRLEERMAIDREAETGQHAARTSKSEGRQDALRELQGLGSEQSSMTGTDSRPSTAGRGNIQQAASSTQEQESEQPSRESQSELWRERRKSLGTYLPNSSYAFSDDGSEVCAAPPLASPDIVVSRYITPMGNVAARSYTTPDPTSEAARHADLYRSLLDDDGACPSGFDIPRTDSAYSSASSNGTVPKYQDLPTAFASRPVRPVQSRTVSGLTAASSAYSSQYTPLPRTRSPGGRVRTPSGNFYAYEPTAHSLQAEQSRAASLGKLHPGGLKQGPNGTLSPASSTDGLSTIFSDTLTVSSCGGTVRAKPKNPHQRHRFPDPQPQNFRQQQQQQQQYGQRSRSKSQPRRPRPVSSHSSNLADRYSGGLAWEWNRESGFGGSAGTRLTGETGTRRKGQRLAESFGVDLGDVPIFLCQSPDGLAPAQQQRQGYFGR